MKRTIAPRYAIQESISFARNEIARRAVENKLLNGKKEYTTTHYNAVEAAAAAVDVRLR
jgi:hypothetical protein